MQFTYDSGEWNSEEHTYIGGEWSSTTNSITATNMSNVDLKVTVSYSQAAGHEGITGSLDADNTPNEAFATLRKAENAETPAAEGGTASWILSLRGEPVNEIENAEIGTITIIVEKTPES